VGPQGPKGDQGDRAEFPSGMLLMLLADEPAPAGYSLIGTFDQVIKPADGGGSRLMTIRLYRKN
jgi:hypothetical protein